MSKPDRYYAFLLVQHVQFEQDIDSPVLIKVTRYKEHAKIKKTVFKAQTNFLMADASHSIHYDSEFCIKIKIVKKHDKIKKQIINIKLEQMNAAKKKREEIGEWHFDAANFENPKSVDIRESKTTLKQNYGVATLWFRCAVLPCSDYPEKPPEHFYNFVTRTCSPQFIDINDTTTTNTETSFGEESFTPINTVNIIQKKTSLEAFNHQPQEYLASFLKPVETKSSKRKQSEVESPPEPKEDTKLAKETDDSKSPDSKEKKQSDKPEDEKKKKKKRRKTSDPKDPDSPEKEEKKKRSKKSRRKTDDKDKDKKKADDKEQEKDDDKEQEKADDKEQEKVDDKEPENVVKKEVEPEIPEKTENKINDTEENTNNALNSEKIPEFSEVPQSLDDQKSISPKPKKQKKLSDLSNINSFFGDKKIRKKSSNVSSSDNLLLQSDEKQVHSYNRLHLSQYYDDFHPLYEKHQKAIMELAVNQCTPIFIKTVMDCFVAPPNVLQDFSDRLLEPINAYGILQFPALTSEVLLELISPVYRGIKIAINKPHQLDEWFSILATTLNFGLKLSNTASLYTSAHIECLNNLAKHISQIIQQLTQTLVATIAPSISDDGFTFADEQAMSMIEQVTRLFLEYTQAFKIPDQIVQVIVVETCNYIDTLLFNVIVDTATVFTDEKVTGLLQKIRQIQQMFDCIPKNFQAAFTHLLNFISQTKALWIGFDNNDDEDAENQKKVILHGKGPLLRSIVDRIQPQIEIPKDLTLDDFGEKVDTKSLKLPLKTASFNFTFEWLYTQNTSNDWDML